MSNRINISIISTYTSPTNFQNKDDEDPNQYKHHIINCMQPIRQVYQIIVAIRVLLTFFVIDLQHKIGKD